VRADRLAGFVRVAALLLIALELALLAATFLAAGRDQEPMLRTMVAVAAAGAGWYQARIAAQPLRQHRLRALVALACLMASLWFSAGAARLVL